MQLRLSRMSFNTDLFLAVILCFQTQEVVTSDRFDLRNALLRVNGKGRSPEEMCLNYNPEFHKLPSSVDSASAVILVDMSETDGCDIQDFNKPPTSLAGATVAISRGYCSFAQKAQNAQSVRVSAVIIIDYKNSTSLPIPSGNSSEYEQINITVATIAWGNYHSLLTKSSSLYVQLYSPIPPKFDYNMVLIVICSTALIMMGSIWLGWSSRVKQTKEHRRRTHNTASDTDEVDETETKNDKGEQITICTVFLLLVFLSGILLLLYFFYDVMVYFFIAVFCWVGSFSLYQCLLPGWSRLVPFTYGIPMDRVPLIKSEVKLRSVILLMVCVTIAVFWAVERHADFAWILQDIMGAAFCVSTIASAQLPSLKIATCLMVLLFVYDVFFVFITPYLTKSGNSIMVDVATGGKSHSGENIPMAFLIPILTDSPIFQCYKRKQSLLGFGDVLLPGLLVGYNTVYDFYAKTRMVYFLSSSAAYAVGMSCCLVGMVFMEKGQPALFYLVPSLLVTTFLLAYCRGDVSKLWSGKHISSKHPEEDSSQESRSEDRNHSLNNVNDEDEDDLQNVSDEHQSLID